MSADRIEPVRFERIRRASALDAADRRAIAQLLAGLVLLIVVAAALGAAIRVFLWASGLGG